MRHADDDGIVVDMEGTHPLNQSVGVRPSWPRLDRALDCFSRDQAFMVGVCFGMALAIWVAIATALVGRLAARLG